MFEASFQVSLYYNSIFFIIIFYSLLLTMFPDVLSKEKLINNINTFLLAIYLVLIIGLREWWAKDVFVDSYQYGIFFESADWSSLDEAKDYGFDFFAIFLKKIGFSVEMFFLFCSFLYVFPIVSLCRKVGRNYSFLFLIFVASSIFFYSYGVNGIRNGIATSLVLLGISYTRFSAKQFFFFILAYVCHQSILLPVFAYYLAYYVTFEKVRLFWIISIPISFIFSNYIENFLSSSGLLGERFISYVNGDMDEFGKVGFRLDFIIYSSLPVIIYSLSKKAHKKIDNFTRNITNMYIISNTFWILINYIAFSNRFAYLSWFLMPFIIVNLLVFYPPFPKIRMIFSTSILVMFYLLTYLLKA